MRRTPRGNSSAAGDRRGWRSIALLLTGFALVMGAVSRAEAARSYTGRDPVFAIRAGGGFYPDMEKLARERFGNRRLLVEDYLYNRRGQAARDVASAYRRGLLPKGVFLVGYSLGGAGAIYVARQLEEQGIPVEMLVLVETVNPVQSIPANVKECINLYHVPAVFGGAVEADSPKTDLFNVRVGRDAGINDRYIHLVIHFADELHTYVTGQVLRGLAGKPPPRELRRIAAQYAREQRAKEGTAGEVLGGAGRLLQGAAGGIAMAVSEGVRGIGRGLKAIGKGLGELTSGE